MDKETLITLGVTGVLLTSAALPKKAEGFSPSTEPNPQHLAFGYSPEAINLQSEELQNQEPMAVVPLTEITNSEGINFLQNELISRGGGITLAEFQTLTSEQVPGQFDDFIESASLTHDFIVQNLNNQFGDVTSEDVITQVKVIQVGERLFIHSQNVDSSDNSLILPIDNDGMSILTFTDGDQFGSGVMTLLMPAQFEQDGEIYGIYVEYNNQAEAYPTYVYSANGNKIPLAEANLTDPYIDFLYDYGATIDNLEQNTGSTYPNVPVATPSGFVNTGFQAPEAPQPVPPEADPLIAVREAEYSADLESIMQNTTPVMFGTINEINVPIQIRVSNGWADQMAQPETTNETPEANAFFSTFFLEALPQTFGFSSRDEFVASAQAGTATNLQFPNPLNLDVVFNGYAGDHEEFNQPVDLTNLTILVVFDQTNAQHPTYYEDPSGRGIGYVTEKDGQYYLVLRYSDTGNYDLNSFFPGQDGHAGSRLYSRLIIAVASGLPPYAYTGGVMGMGPTAQIDSLIMNSEDTDEMLNFYDNSSANDPFQLIR